MKHRCVNSTINSTLSPNDPDISRGRCAGRGVCPWPYYTDNRHIYFGGHRIQRVGAGRITGDNNGLYMFCL